MLAGNFHIFTFATCAASWNSQTLHLTEHLSTYSRPYAVSTDIMYLSSIPNYVLNFPLFSSVPLRWSNALWYSALHRPSMHVCGYHIQCLCIHVVSNICVSSLACPWLDPRSNPSKCIFDCMPANRCLPLGQLVPAMVSGFNCSCLLHSHPQPTSDCHYEMTWACYKWWQEMGWDNCSVHNCVLWWIEAEQLQLESSLICVPGVWLRRLMCHRDSLLRTYGMIMEWASIERMNIATE